jgi:hypothetical protein
MKPGKRVRLDEGRASVGIQPDVDASGVPALQCAIRGECKGFDILDDRFALGQEIANILLILVFNFVGVIVCRRVLADFQFKCSENVCLVTASKDGRCKFSAAEKLFDEHRLTEFTKKIPAYPIKEVRSIDAGKMIDPLPCSLC